METSLGTGLLIVGVALVALLVVLSALAGAIYFITGVIKDPEETEQEDGAVLEKPAVDPGLFDRALKQKVALIAVALARSAYGRHSGKLEGGGEVGSWRQFHLARRLSQNFRVRRSP
jgi:Na+-transporting methylmalonyl-CoA/oxaloacetate decarboxylase gamma subunit